MMRMRAGLGPPSGIGNPGLPPMGGMMGGGMMGGGRPAPAPSPTVGPRQPIMSNAPQQQRIQPDESSIIVRALIERLRQLTPKQNAQTA